MPTKRPKLYLFVDETGQETRGQFFLVAVVVVPADQADFLREQLLELERFSKKGKSRWAKTKREQRATFLSSLPSVLAPLSPICWREYGKGTDYSLRTAQAIVAAVRQHDPNREADLTVIVDGANWEEIQLVARVFRDAGLQRRKIRGGRDESEPLLRLADAMAGFLRDVLEKQTDALAAWKLLDGYFGTRFDNSDSQQ